MTSIVAVAIGGAIGSALRYYVGAAFLRIDPAAGPWGTLTVNVSGALALGFLARYFGPPHGSPAIFLALTVGVCGGFTTFSTFTLDTFTLVERGEVSRAVLYAAGSVALSYLGLASGYQAARMLRPLP